MADKQDLFGGIFNKIPTDIKKVADITRNPLQVPLFAGLDIKNWFKAKIESVGPFTKFSFKLLKGRVPFTQFEKNFMPKVPNIFPQANPLGFEDVVSVLENLFDELSADEEEDYQEVRYKLHVFMTDFVNYVRESEIVDILQDYHEYDLSLIKEFYLNWQTRVDCSDASLRDQLIDLLAFINSVIAALVDIKLTIDRRTAELVTEEILILREFVVRIESMLNDFGVELETMVERLTNLLTYSRVSRVQRYRVERIAQLVKNPLFRYVRSDFLRAQTTSVSPLATSFADKGNDVRTQSRAAQASVGTNARLATPVVGNGDTIQQDQQTETIATNGSVGPLSEQDWQKLRGWLLQKESSGDYSSVNRYGYCGGYQMGGGALIDLGYAKAGTKTSTLRIASNWTGRNGISSREDFLANTQLQDATVLEYARMNYKRMLNSGTVSKEDSKAHVAGLLAISHLLGTGGARDYKNGKDGADANGTTASVYYNGGSGAVGGPTAVSSQEEAETNKIAVESSVLDDTASITVPSSDAAPVYPYNRVRQFESGHFEEFDNTPGSERVQVRHKNGSGYEFQADGTAVYMAKGDKYDAVIGNNFIIVEGICNIYVKGNAGIVSEGDVNINAANDINMFAGGDFNIRANGKYSAQIDGSSNENIKGDSARLVGGFSKISADGDVQIDAGSFSAVSREGNMNLVSLGDIGIVTNGNFAATVSGDSSIVTKGTSLNISYGDQYLVASSKMTINGDSLFAHGGSSATYGSDGSTTVAGGGTIKLSHPVEKALFADESTKAGTIQSVSPVSPSGSSSDGGGGQMSSSYEARPEKDNTQKIVENYEAQSFDDTMAYSGGGQGRDPSKVDPLTITST